MPYFQVNPLQLIWRSGIPLDSIYGCVNYACPCMLTSKWHQNSALLTLCEGNSRCPVVSLHKGQWCGNHFRVMTLLWRHRYIAGSVATKWLCLCVLKCVLYVGLYLFAELDKGYGHNHLLIFLTPETIHYFACMWRVICRHLNLELFPSYYINSFSWSTLQIRVRSMSIWFLSGIGVLAHYLIFRIYW